MRDPLTSMHWGAPARRDSGDSHPRHGGALQGSWERLGPTGSRSGSPVTTPASPVTSIGDGFLMFDIENPRAAAGIPPTGTGDAPGERVESTLNPVTGQWKSHSQGLAKGDEVMTRSTTACAVGVWGRLQ